MMHVVESSIKHAASKLSVFLDILPSTRQNTEPEQPDSQLDTHVVDLVSANLLLKEIQTFVDRKSQLRARTGSRADFLAIFMHQHDQQDLQQHDGRLLHLLTDLIKAGMRRVESSLNGPPASLTDVAMATGDRLEQLVVYRKAYSATLRKLVLNRKACYAEINQLAQLQVDRTTTASSSSDPGSQAIPASFGVGGSELNCWDAREREVQALSSAIERLQRNVTDSLKLVEDFGDSVMLEIFPPTVRYKRCTGHLFYHALLDPWPRPG
eukprot:COSAG02_NODE_12_length_58022_cov_242.077379_47_plen_267_part_00